MINDDDNQKCKFILYKYSGTSAIKEVETLKLQPVIMTLPQT